MAPPVGRIQHGHRAAARAGYHHEMGAGIGVVKVHNGGKRSLGQSVVITAYGFCLETEFQGRMLQVG